MEKFRLFKDEGEGRDLAVNENNYYLLEVLDRAVAQWRRKRGDGKSETAVGCFRIKRGDQA
jgi:hypothetical protein